MIVNPVTIAVAQGVRTASTRAVAVVVEAALTRAAAARLAVAAAQAELKLAQAAKLAKDALNLAKQAKTSLGLPGSGSKIACKKAAEEAAKKAAREKAAKIAKLKHLLAWARAHKNLPRAMKLLDEIAALGG